MAGDNLAEILDLARRSMPDVPADVWARFESLIRANYGTSKIYVAASRKRSHLEAIAAAGADADAATLAKQLGLTVRRIRQLKGI